jgi:ABC-type antimicrobial peptide transport system permease subunit
MKRQDLSLVALVVEPGTSPAEIDLFCKERVDLELQAVTEPAYYATLQRHFQPVRTVAWLVVLLVAGAGTFAGLNTMYGAVVGRTRELAMLQATGFRRRAIVVSLVQEGTLLAAAASLLAGAIALGLAEGAAVRFSMGAFSLKVDSTTVLIGCGTGLLVGVAGTIPPAIRAMRQSVAESLKAI